MKLKWQPTLVTAKGILKNARFAKKFMILITFLNMKKNIIKRSNVIIAKSNFLQKVYKNTLKDVSLKKHFVAIVNWTFLIHSLRIIYSCANQKLSNAKNVRLMLAIKIILIIMRLVMEISIFPMYLEIFIKILFKSTVMSRKIKIIVWALLYQNFSKV